MAELKPTLVRDDFSAIVSGWGGDGLDDLVARAQLMAEWWRDHVPLTMAEHKIARAIKKRISDLSGIDFQLPN